VLEFCQDISQHCETSIYYNGNTSVVSHGTCIPRSKNYNTTEHNMNQLLINNQDYKSFLFIQRSGHFLKLLHELFVSVLMC
jgi:hypothetical protein